MGKLFEELKRRKVFRVTGVYAVIAWVLIQVADVVLPTFGAPAWVNQTLIFLFVIGFPVAIVLAWAYEVTPEGVRSESGVASQTQTPVPQSQVFTYATFILVLLAVGFQITDRFLFSSENQIFNTASGDVSSTSISTSGLSRRFSIDIGSTIPFGSSFTNAEIALSPDGSKLVYRVFRQETGTDGLFLRNLDQLENKEDQLLTQSRNTFSPFFSEDGQWVGFTAGDGDGLYKIPIRGGSPLLITQGNRGGTGGFWSADDTIFYTSNDSNQLERGSPNGGVSKPLVTDEQNTNPHESWPDLLPDEDALLYTVAAPEEVVGGHIDILVQSSGEKKTLIQNGYNARYVPTGHIVFVRDASLWAVPFDADSLEITGPERRVVQGIQTNTQRGPTLYTFSDDGLLVYLPGEETNQRLLETTLVWVDREGNEEVVPQTRSFRRWAVSPDGQRLAVTITEGGMAADIWIYDLTRDTLSRLTFDEADDFRPLWTPDGERIVFASDRDGGGMWSRAANGTGVAERLSADANTSPYAITPDGTQLLYFSRDSAGSIFTLTPGDEVSSQPLIQTEFNTGMPDLSPDGRWLAYRSNETGRHEIYVRPYPNIEDGKWQISSEGGSSPKWSPDGLELFFSRRRDSALNLSGEVWVAQRETANTAQFNTPVLAIEGSDGVSSSMGTFDISADGSRLLLQKESVSRVQETEVTLLVAVDNWFEELKRLAPPDPQ